MTAVEIYREALLAIIGSPVRSSEALELIDIAVVAMARAQEEERNEKKPKQL
jgi:hypothetical protein